MLSLSFFVAAGCYLDTWWQKPHEWKSNPVFVGWLFFRRVFLTLAPIRPTHTNIWSMTNKLASVVEGSYIGGVLDTQRKKLSPTIRLTSDKDTAASSTGCLPREQNWSFNCRIRSTKDGNIYFVYAWQKKTWESCCWYLHPTSWSVKATGIGLVALNASLLSAPCVSVVCMVSLRR